MKQLEMLYEGKAKQVFRTDDDDVILMHYKDAATAFNNIRRRPSRARASSITRFRRSFSAI